MAKEMTADAARIGQTPPASAMRGAARHANEATRLGRIDVHADPEQALAAWAELEAIAPGSLYQTRRWLLPWIATAGRAAGIEPMLVVGYRDDLPVVFFPFGIVQHRGLRIAGFLGGKDSNANLGLIRPGTAFNRADLVTLFAAAAAKAAVKPDLFVLLNQPEQWENSRNPVTDLFRHQLSPSYCHRGDLAPQFDAFLKTHLSADGRKNLRRKQKRLAEIGAVTHIQARTEDEVRRVLDAFVAQKRQRLALVGIKGTYEDPSALAFLEAAALDGIAGNGAAIELHALAAGDRIVATFGGGIHRGRFHGMINSYDLDAEIARCSPGELLLAQLVEDKCRAGLASFDLGIGEARYKDTWCDAAEPLFDTLLPVSTKGRAAAFGESISRRMKRLVKQTDWAWAAAKKLRAR